MSVTVEVGLLSGKTATVQAGLDETVETLKRRAQMALGVGERAASGLTWRHSGWLCADQGCQSAEW